jgi:hypothetical protein
MNLASIGLILLGLLSFSADAALGDEYDKISLGIAAWNRSKICPVGTYSLLKFDNYCKDFCDKISTCRGNASTDPCENGSAPDECNRFSNASQQCYHDMNQKNQLILEYNGIVNHCHTNHSSNDSSNKLYDRAPLRDNPYGDCRISSRIRDCKQVYERDVAQCDSRFDEMNPRWDDCALEAHTRILRCYAICARQ